MMRRARWFLAFAIATPWALPTFAGAEVPAAELYQLHCSGCHGSDGSGATGAIPSLRGLRPFLATPAGRAYLVRVPGVSQAAVGDADLARLLDWIVSDLSAVTDAAPFAGDEVGSFRTRPLRDPLAERARVLGVTSAAP